MSSKIHPYLEPLRELFADHADPEIAAGQQAYMKDKFQFFGIKTPQRRALVRGFLKEHGRPPGEQLAAVVRSAFAQPQREFHYTGMELFTHAAKKLGPEYLPLAEELILTHSWWDMVDHIAVHGVGAILRRHPQLIHEVNERYMASGELWLQRTALIFQLQYKEHTDQKLLFSNIERLADHKDFFIRKGIGWALRQYARIDPKAVKEFIGRQSLSPLSVHEAGKHL
jgi:3-methyladenine DNA glycosylase AlkD